MSRRVFELSLAVLVVCLLAVASPAGARSGNPIKKAKEKLQKATGQQVEGQQTPEGDDVVFDNVVVELTNDRVAKVVAAFQKASAEGAARPQLQDQYNQKNAERNEVTNKNGEALNALREKRGEVDRCYQDNYRKITERKTQDLAANPMDPARLAKNAKLAAENNAAAAKGDSAAIQRMQTALNAEMFPSKEESLAVRKSCGPPPPKSAVEQRIDTLDKDIASLSEELRKFDERIAKAQAKEGSLTQQQWSVAMERVTMYDAATKQSKGSDGAGRKGKGEKSDGGNEAKGGDSQGASDGEGADVIYVKGFTKAELEVLAKNRAALRAALR
jgi:hypothetical protein